MLVSSHGTELTSVSIFHDQQWRKSYLEFQQIQHLSPDQYFLLSSYSPLIVSPGSSLGTAKVGFWGSILTSYSIHPVYGILLPFTAA